MYPQVFTFNLKFLKTNLNKLQVALSVPFPNICFRGGCERDPTRSEIDCGVFRMIMVFRLLQTTGERIRDIWAGGSRGTKHTFGLVARMYLVDICRRIELTPQTYREVG
jgi:hypothetical protein